VEHRKHLRVVQVLDAQQLLHLVHAGLGEGGAVGLLVDPEVAGFLDFLVVIALRPLLELWNQPVHHGVELGVLLGGARNDQRRSRLVDQDRVDLVDDGVVERTLNALGDRELHVVAQVVEAQLVVGDVGDVGGVGVAAIGLGDVVHDGRDVQPEESVHVAHPLGIAAGQVVVDGHHVHTPAREAVQVRRQGGHQRLALAGLHLGDLAPVQDDASHQLHVVMALPQRAFGGLAHHGEGLGQQVVQGLALVQALAEVRGPAPQVGVRELHETGLEGVGALHQGDDGFQHPVVVASEDLANEARHGQRVSLRRGGRAGRVY
jgi:hypothetical protein